MHKKILSDVEKKTIKQFLENGKSSIMVRMIRYRAKRFLPTFKEDVELLERFLKHDYMMIMTLDKKSS